MPMCVDGPYDMIFGQRQRILIGEPFYVELPEGGMTKEFLKEEAERCRNIVIGMQEDLRKRYKGKYKPVRNI